MPGTTSVVVEFDDMELLDGHRFAGGGDAEQRRTRVGAAHLDSRGDAIAFPEQVSDRDVEVRHRRPEHRNRPFQVCRHVRFIGAEGVPIDRSRRESRVDGREITPSESVLENTTHSGFGLLNIHDAPIRSCDTRMNTHILRPMTENVKRNYNSAVRREHAEATRLRIIEAARTLFLANGYAKTAVPAIAAAAEVSPDTVFHVFKNKRTLLREVIDLDIGGDSDGTPIMQRAPALAVRDELDQHTQLRIFASGIARQVSRIRALDDILVGAAAVDEDIAALRSDIQDRQRRAAMMQIAEWVRARGELAVDVETAGTTIWALTSPEMHRMLCERSGWTTDRYARWLEATLASSLLVTP